MPLSDWLKVRHEIGVPPIVEGLIEGPVPIFVERYLLRATECAVSAVPEAVISTHFGGNAVSEGESGHSMRRYLPLQSNLVPP